ncbi:hypothetical protein [Heyndrickxia ginsengihumi]|uniref:hypothetical protein n=1 Tax=Heyndrickxia ginsengihumi TaxID=363870 RepID=UPI003D206686
MHNKFKYYIFLLLLVIVFVTYTIFPHQQTKESILFFPIEKEARFTKTKTSLHQTSSAFGEQYHLLWSIESTLDRKAYLRQDVGLLYENGQLKGTLGIKKWKTNTETIKEQKIVSNSESALFQAITFHYGELHNGESIRSTQKMSNAQLYMIVSPSKHASSFIHPKNKAESEWQVALNQYTTQRLQSLWIKGKAKYGLTNKELISIPLTDLYQYNQTPIRGLSIADTQKIIGQLWEGLYKNYMIGFRNENKPPMNPIGSYLPLVVINLKEKTLYVLIPTKDQDYVLLKQRIS